jgi:hypothetical protein
MNEPLNRYDITVTVGCDGNSLPDPAAFAAAADRAAWSRSASIISAHLADKIISIVTVTAPDRYAAVTVARAVISDALKRQALASSQLTGERAQAEPQKGPYPVIAFPLLYLGRLAAVTALTVGHLTAG